MVDPVAQNPEQEPVIPPAPDLEPLTSEPMGSEASSLHPGVLDGKIADYYFTPKAFESEELYRKLGVGIFKKYMPHGDWVVRRVQRKAPWLNYIRPGGFSANREDRLRTFERMTRKFEAIHIGGFALLGALQISNGDYTSGPGKALSSAALQVGVNIYPIMTQRFNRLRTDRILERAENHTSPNEADS